MIVRFDNVNPNSSSGPNNFARKLATKLVSAGHQVTLGFQRPDVQLSFIQQTVAIPNVPTVLRLDGIYFNSIQDWQRMNEPIKASYDRADAVIVQSDFDKKLIARYFGDRGDVYVIRNGTSLEGIDAPVGRGTGPVDDLLRHKLDGKQLWLCASHWRPHKRLKQNVEAFLRLAPRDAVLAIAGESTDPNEIPECVAAARGRTIVPLGELAWDQLVGAMKLADVFVHLAWLDHCPNVVVDARAAGCKLLVSSAGGTVELARRGDLVIREDEWDFEPCELYSPPALDFDRLEECDGNDATTVDMGLVADWYLDVLRGVVR